MKYSQQKIFSFLGWIGSVCILTGYFLLIEDIISVYSLLYLFLNLVGSLLVSLNLWFQKANGPLFMQLCFLAISLYGLAKYIM